jgi:Tfp pilus assembly protein PilX
MQIHQERGIALIVALFLMTALSVLGASMMFLSQTETYASLNYRVMSQARYAAEAGVQKASNFLLDPAQYAMPTPVGGTDPMTNYDTTKSPVRFANAPVVLSATTGIASNYPVAAVKDAFNAAAKGTLSAGNAGLTYNAYATLISMQKFDSYGGTQQVVQTWEITADGGLTGSSKATVEVVAQIETPRVPANSYAAFATANTCDAIYFHGNTTINSYDSSDPSFTASIAAGLAHSTMSTGGDVGTNGNLHIQGSVDVEGNLYTPRSGVGTCSAGAVTGLTEGGSAQVDGSMVQLPKAVAYPKPIFSTVPPTTSVTINSTGLLAANKVATCAALGLTYGDTTTVPVGNCTVSGSTLTVDGHGSDVTLPSVTVANGITLVFQGNSPPANVNINSLDGTGAVQVNANMTGALNQEVVLKVAGKNPVGVTSPTLADPTDMVTPINLATLSWKQNAPAQSLDASSFQIAYGGTGTISMQGNNQSAVTIYAPNATFGLTGTADLFGSVLAKTVDNGGDANIHYDRRLRHDFWVAGLPMVSTFSWKRSQ